MYVHMSEFPRYNPNRSAEWNYGGAKWKLSRSKIDLFLECPRCFYIDNKLGTKRPTIPSFNLNIAVDELLKKEFDEYRIKQVSHPLQIKYNVAAVPFKHAALDQWRDPFIGITYTHPEHGFTISGGIDDLWVTQTGELLVVDYKATAKEGTITSLTDSSWTEQYERQLAVYQWLLRQNDFTVHDTAYIVYCNGQKNQNQFNDTLVFETTLIACTPNTDWIEPTLQQIKLCLERDTYPASSPDCEYCRYREAVGKKLQAIHKHHVT